VDAGVHLLNGLISYWKVDESGLPFADSKGTNPFTGGGGSGAAGAPGKINTAASFNGTAGSYFNCPSSSSLNPPGDFTWSVWLYSTNGSAALFALSKGDYTLEPPTQFYLGYGDANGFFFGGSQDSIVHPLNTWYHLIGWWDSATQCDNCQVNNGAVFTGPVRARVLTSSSLNFGALANNSAPLGNWNGRIDEIGYWSRKLTDAEKTQLYNGGAGWAFSNFTA